MTARVLRSPKCRDSGVRIYSILFYVDYYNHQRMTRNLARYGPPCGNRPREVSVVPQTGLMRLVWVSSAIHRSR